MSLEAQILIQWVCKRVEDERYAFDCTSNRHCSSVQHVPLRRFLELLFVRTFFVPLSSIIQGESRQTVSGGMKTPFLNNYMPYVKLCRSEPFSDAIADTSRQEGRVPCPLWDPTKKTVSFPSFKRFSLSSSQKYLSFAFVPNLFRWTPRSGGKIFSAYDISRPKAKSSFSFPTCGLDHD